ncbi:MAG: hypothetical protein IKK38_09480, partial [Spirochaetaceae bacterium]|nr:hypothetical protein [Spirochaetaceae bacterium]
ERTPTQSVRGIVRSAKELHSGLIPFISPQRGMFPTETGIKPSARIKDNWNYLPFLLALYTPKGV